jgi:hypothetical protein
MRDEILGFIMCMAKGFGSGTGLPHSTNTAAAKRYKIQTLKPEA